MRNRTTATLGAIAAIAAAALAAALLAACSSSTDPGGGGGDTELEITYQPSAFGIPCLLGGSTMLQAIVAGADRAEYAWTVAGEPAGTGAGLLYEPQAIGIDTVTVRISAAGRWYGRSWVFMVSDPPDVLPLPVPELSVEHGAVPTTILVRWRQPPSNGEAIDGYLVAVNYGRSITTANWDAATVLGFVPRDPTALMMSATFGEADGLVLADNAWFAVRTRDVRGRLAPVAVSRPHDIDYAWSIDVILNDDLGRPVPDTTISCGGSTVWTNLQGRAVIGPLSSAAPVRLVVETPHFGPRPLDLNGGAGDISLVLALLPRYGTAHEPCGTSEPADFLELFRRATRTQGLGGNPTLLWKWEHYPLQVWIPAVRSPHLDWDLQALAATALEIWNDALGETCLVAAADSLGADIVFSFRPLPGYNGYTTLLEPEGELGEVIPRRIRLEVELDLDAVPVPHAIWVTEIALHELGHALGFYGHLCGTGKGNLMDWGGALGSLAEGPADAIHPDEVRVVRAVRHLPQGLDVSRW